MVASTHDGNPVVAAMLAEVLLKNQRWELPPADTGAQHVLICMLVGTQPPVCLLAEAQQQHLRLPIPCPILHSCCHCFLTAPADEKRAIARRYLEPQSRTDSGVPDTAVQLTDPAMDSLIDEYCRWGS